MPRFLWVSMKRTHPLEAFLSQNERFASERLVHKHASLPCLCELSACQTNVGVNACFRSRRQLRTPEIFERAGLRACRTQHGECPKPMHGLAHGGGEGDHVFGSSAVMDIDEVACVWLQNRKVANVHHDSRRSVKMWIP